MVPVAQERSEFQGRRRRLLPWSFAAGALLFTVCYHDVRPCENPPPFYLTLEADKQLNPDERGHSLPTQFLVIQLRAMTRFNAAGFDELWQKPKETLGDELAQINEVSVAPGATVTVGFPRSAQATSVAVIGIFRKHSADSWRAVAPLAVVPGERCTPQPSAIKPRPGPDDVLLKFHVQGVQVQNLTPPPAPHGGCA